VRLLAAFAFALAAIALPALGQKGPPPAVAEVAIVQLPKEARETLVLIRQRGPFPYAKDGSIFGNREGLLPAQKRGYYREYTVKTPGERTRGARRIVVGKGGEIYYTDDHYNHFRRIRE
jgi:ribonuclease T1